MEPERAGDPKTYEEAYKRLHKAVEDLEAGPLPLEAAMARYEEGVRLARLCNEMLDRAELRLHHVAREPGGGATES